MRISRVFELLPLAVTSLIPVVLLPMMGIVDTEEISHFYMKVIIVNRLVIIMIKTNAPLPRAQECSLSVV